MKYLVVLLFASLSLQAQDSTAIKLQQYKDLHEKGLITDTEYDKLRKRELNLSSVDPKPEDLNKLQRRYKTQLITGSLDIAAGASLIGTGFYFLNKPKYEEQPTINGHTRVYVGSYTTEARIFFVCGSVFTGVGIYLVAKGGVNRNKYFDLKASPTDLSINLHF